MNFDPSFNVGQIIEGMGFIITLLASFYSLKSTVEKISEREAGHYKSMVEREAEHHKTNSDRLDKMDAEMRKQTDILVTLAAQRAELDGMKARLAMLEERNKHHD